MALAHPLVVMAGFLYRSSTTYTASLGALALASSRYFRSSGNNGIVRFAPFEWCSVFGDWTQTRPFSQSISIQRSERVSLGVRIGYRKAIGQDVVQMRPGARSFGLGYPAFSRSLVSLLNYFLTVQSQPSNGQLRVSRLLVSLLLAFYPYLVSRPRGRIPACVRTVPFD